MTAYTMTTNTAYNSLEIKFDGKPSEATRDALKAMKFRWHSVKKVWYGYKTESEVIAALEGKTEGAKAETATANAEKVNKYGVKVGDLFYMSWGYEQTNVDFFQVIALAGDTSVRVRAVNPEIVKDEAVGPMAADRVYKTNTEGKLLSASSSSVFIKDQEKGDIKRVQVSKYNEAPYIKMDHHFAHRCGEETIKVYESWYY